MRFPRLLQLLISISLLSVSDSVIEAGPQATSHRAPGANSAPTAHRPALVFVQAPIVAAGDLAHGFPQGSRIVRSEAGSGAGELVSLTSEFFAAADPQVSFDATRILFAAQLKPDARWQIWEMQADGTSKRQVTRLDADCVRPSYHARDTIVFTVLAAQDSQVYISQLDGSDAQPITFGPGNYQVETVLRDGRVLVSAASPLVAGAEAAGSLYVLRPDGSGLSSLRCEHLQPAHRREAAELADGSIVFVKTPSPNAVGGELAMIRRGAAHNSKLNSPGAVSLSPRSWDEKHIVVARRSARNERFDLYAFDAAAGHGGAPIFQDPKLSSVQAVPLASHDVPRWYWSTLKPEERAGYFVCLDAYQSADEPGGRIAAAVSKVRVLILENGKERSLGESAVEPDGSFYIAVPADKPVRFELLDVSGAVVRAQKSWIWARPGEERGCVGCHEDKAVAPENRWPQALRRFDTPTRLGVETEEMRAAH